MPRVYVRSERWTDCPVLGAAASVKGEFVARGMLSLMGFTPAVVERVLQWRDSSYRPGVLHCGWCTRPIGLELGQTIVQPTGCQHRIRTVEVPQDASRSTGKCNGVCLNGKRSCDCRCRGACHGAGQCSCGSAKEA